MASWPHGIMVSEHHGITVSWLHCVMTSWFMVPQWTLFTIGQLDFTKSIFVDLGIETGLLFGIALHRFMHMSNEVS